MNHTATPWQFWTSNSLKRITCAADNKTHQDGGVLSTYKHPSEGYADIRISEGDMEFLITAVNAHEDLVAALKALCGEIAEFKNDAALRYRALQLAYDVLKKVGAQ